MVSVIVTAALVATCFYVSRRRHSSVFSESVDPEVGRKRKPADPNAFDTPATDSPESGIRDRLLGVGLLETTETNGPLVELFRELTYPITLIDAAHRLLHKADPRSVPDLNKEWLEQAITNSLVYGRMKKRDGLSVDELAVIRLYTMEAYQREQSFYFMVNRALRSTNRREVWPFAPMIWLLLNALKATPKRPETTLFRGIRAGDMATKYNAGDLICWNSFNSCTTSVAPLSVFMGMTGKRIQFVITPHPVHARYRSISQYSQSPNEEEVLYLPNSLFSVQAVVQLADDLLQVQLKEEDSHEALIDL